MSPSLPVELIVHSVDFIPNQLYVDIRALAACALTCRALLPTSRKHIWSTAVVVPFNSPFSSNTHTQRLVELLQIVDSNPAIALYVRSLTLKSIGDEGLESAWNVDDHRLWELFPRIRTLTFERLAILDLPVLLPICHSLLYLEELVVKDAVELYNHHSPPTTSFRDNSIVLDTAPRLKRIRLDGEFKWTPLIDLAHAFLEQGMHTSLEVIDLGWSSLSRARSIWGEPGPPTIAWVPVIASIGSTLREFTVTLTYEPAAAPIFDMYDALMQCTNLRMLGISINLLGFTSRASTTPHASRFIDALAERLSHPAMQPLHRLERLTLSWSRRSEIPGFHEVCEKLGRALVGDRERYPSFRQLCLWPSAPWLVKGLAYELFGARQLEKEALLDDFAIFCKAGVDVEVTFPRMLLLQAGQAT